MWFGSHDDTVIHTNNEDEIFLVEWTGINLALMEAAFEWSLAKVLKPCRSSIFKPAKVLQELELVVGFEWISNIFVESQFAVLDLESLRDMHAQVVRHRCLRKGQ